MAVTEQRTRPFSELCSHAHRARNEALRENKPLPVFAVLPAEMDEIRRANQNLFPNERSDLSTFYGMELRVLGL